MDRWRSILLNSEAWLGVEAHPSIFVLRHEDNKGANGSSSCVGWSQVEWWEGIQIVERTQKHNTSGNASSAFLRRFWIVVWSCKFKTTIVYRGCKSCTIDLKQTFFSFLSMEEIALRCWESPIDFASASLAIAAAYCTLSSSLLRLDRTSNNSSVARTILCGT